MNIRPARLVAALFLPCLTLASSPGQTVVLTNCVGGDFCVLSELLAGETMQIDDKLFSNFLFRTTQVNNAGDIIGSDPPVQIPFNPGVPVSADEIRVHSQQDALGALGVPGEIGLAFNFGFGAPSQIILLEGGQDITIHIEYDVTVVGGQNLIVDNTLLFPEGFLNGASISSIADTPDGASLTVNEIALSATGQPLFDVKSIAANDNGDAQMDHRDFAGVTSLHVVTDIVGIGGNILTGSNVQLDWLVESFSQQPVPEPATIAVFGLGLAGIGFATRRKKAA